MIVPELICSDLARSVEFYVARLGFAVGYTRPRERFALLSFEGGAELMLEQPVRRDRLFPRAPLEHPYGRGMNLEISVADVRAVHARCSDLPLVLPLEERTYARETDEVRVRQFAVADPDGYVLRFTQSLPADDVAVVEDVAGAGGGERDEDVRGADAGGARH
ncbi:MAG TPA: VOC family protein [Solirubrobacteraceae bacterium]|nr:VOC family protein [Solirubrobacteraceae bacterium]